jgi:hypothetical protein
MQVQVFNKFGNNTYPRRIRRRSNVGHIFGEGNTVYIYCLKSQIMVYVARQRVHIYLLYTPYTGLSL